jgi:hypothetical protein
MKVEFVTPPVVRSVTVTMSEEEARVLHWLTTFDSTIPSAISRVGNSTHQFSEITNLFSALGNAFRAAGVSK